MTSTLRLAGLVSAAFAAAQPVFSPRRIDSGRTVSTDRAAGAGRNKLGEEIVLRVVKAYPELVTAQVNLVGTTRRRTEARTLC